MEIDDFQNLAEGPANVCLRRGSFGVKTAAIYVCTRCGKVAAPKFDRNLRCDRCTTPLIKSMESVIQVQRQIKENYMLPDMVAELRQKVKDIRSMKSEYADTKGLPWRKQPEFKERPNHSGSVKVDMVGPSTLVYTITIRPCSQYPDGFKGDIEIPIE